MEGYEKSEKLKLNKLTDENIVDILALDENFEILEGIVDKLKDMELTDERVDCVEEKKKLNVVIKELRGAIKDNKGKIEGLKIDDEHVKVISEDKMLNLVLTDLFNADKQATKEIQSAQSDISAILSEMKFTTSELKKFNDKVEEIF